MKKITVVVVDDHKLIREMFVELFFNHENIKVVGESGGFDDAVEMIKAKLFIPVKLTPSFRGKLTPLQEAY